MTNGEDIPWITNLSFRNIFS